MGSGLPVVATKVPGSDELVSHGENGFLVEPRDVNALAKVLTTLINDRSLREQMGVSAQKIAKRYTWERVAKQYIVLYQHIGDNHVCSVPTGD